MVSTHKVAGSNPAGSTIFGVLMRKADFTDILFGNAGKIIIGILLIIIFIGFYNTYEYRSFMKECTKDHKEYECKVMWNQTQPKHTYIYLPN